MKWWGYLCPFFHFCGLPQNFVVCFLGYHLSLTSSSATLHLKLGPHFLLPFKEVLQKTLMLCYVHVPYVSLSILHLRVLILNLPKALLLLCQGSRPPLQGCRLLGCRQEQCWVCSHSLRFAAGKLGYSNPVQFWKENGELELLFSHLAFQTSTWTSQN